MATEWFYRISGETLGPVSGEELLSLAKRGRVRPSTLVRRGIQGAWVNADRVKGLFKHASGKSSQPPPVPAR